MRPGHATEAPAIHVEVIFVLILAKIAVLLAMSVAGALSMDIMSLQIRLEHLVILLAYRVTVNLQSINAALTITVMESDIIVAVMEKVRTCAMQMGLETIGVIHMPQEDHRPELDAHLSPLIATMVAMVMIIMGATILVMRPDHCAMDAQIWHPALGTAVTIIVWLLIILSAATTAARAPLLARLTSSMWIGITAGPTSPTESVSTAPARTSVSTLIRPALALGRGVTTRATESVLLRITNVPIPSTRSAK